MTSVLKRREETHSHIERWPCDGRGKVGIIFPEAKEYVGRPEPRRDKEGSSPRGCKGVSSTNTLISDIQPVEL